MNTTELFSITNEQINMLQDIATGMSDSQVAEKYNKSESLVSNLRTGFLGIRKKRINAFDGQFYDKVNTLIEEGKNNNQIISQLLSVDEEIVKNVSSLRSKVCQIRKKNITKL